MTWSIYLMCCFFVVEVIAICVVILLGFLGVLHTAIFDAYYIG